MLMPDELDPQLLRRFAQAHQPLIDAQFTAQVMARLQHTQRLRLSLSAARDLTATIVAAVTTGIRAPLRLRHAGLLAIAAAAVTLWTAVQSL
jgi:hypothetical protein